eukprot:2286077-Pleurochrysis_carterae.AAC.2
MGLRVLACVSACACGRAHAELLVRAPAGRPRAGRARLRARGRWRRAPRRVSPPSPQPPLPP